MNGCRDLRLVALMTIICALGSLITPLGAVRVVFAAPLAIFLPGYALTLAAFGPRSPRPTELVPLGVGISLAMTALSSVVLNFTPGGIRGLPWAVILVVLVLACCRVAARRARPQSEQRVAIALPRVTIGAALALGGCLALSAAALVLAQTTPHADKALGYTELWMVPRGQTDNVARIGITSQQQYSTAYRLRVRIGGRPAAAEREFSLEPGKSLILGFDHRPSSLAVPIEARLFLRGRPHTVYRSIHGWLPAEGT